MNEIIQSNITHFQFTQVAWFLQFAHLRGLCIRHV